MADAREERSYMMEKRKLLGGICLLTALLAAGCGNPGGEVENSQGDSVSLNMVSENAFADIASENETGVTVSENESHNILEEGETIALSNGLYAYVTTQVSRDIAIEGITEWIRIQDKDPEEGTYYDDHTIGEDHVVSANWILIPNVYGAITDIQMDGNSEILICYEDDEGEGKDVAIQMDFYAAEDDIVTTPFRRIRDRNLCFNREELTNKTTFPVEVWSETFISGENEYTATFSRISPMYETTETVCWLGHKADYQFAIQRGDEILYIRKLYEFMVEYEEVHYMEDVNGDGVDDFIIIDDGEGSDAYEPEYAYPYVFVWNPEEETCIYGGAVVPDGKAVYDDASTYMTVLYDKDTGIFYDISYIHQRNIQYDSIIMRGAKFVDGKWKTVYELYLGTEEENYVREIKYDEEGNIISETIYTVADINDLINEFYEICELNLFYGILDDYTKDDIVVDEQFSYWKYVRKEE